MTHSDDRTRRDFDRASLLWDEKSGRVRLAEDVAEAILREVPLDRGMDCLDFGCGTGLLTLLLAPRVGTVTAVDGSPGMLDVLKGKIARTGWTGVTTRLADLDGDNPLGGPYHLAFSSMTLHHIRDVPALVRRVHASLRRGGQLALADLDSEEGRFHGDPRGVFHPGFERSSLAAVLEEAGFRSVRAVTAARVTKKGEGGVVRDFTVFLMTGIKPAEKEGSA